MYGRHSSKRSMRSAPLKGTLQFGPVVRPVSRSQIHERRNMQDYQQVRIEKWGHRHWAVYDGPELVCIALYKIGALEVKRRLESKLMDEDRANPQKASVISELDSSLL